ncbi:MAG: hypothetical protein Tp176DCM1853251_56 [Prokaryotic dsDNA virus sp.]|nr:MAG: hypothetical protein Tp176DCM1853251_56 [Prokaryotic dsDNA virus sp.]|tara:strand:+ start:25407 stop:25781 length:375 start_codon:yes stop_codon:yes gene_type:complete
MPTLPTASEVIAITGTAMSEALVSALIDDAALVVADSTCFSGYSDEKQTAIIKWLAAHIVASTGPGAKTGALTSRKLGDAQQSFARATMGEGLRGTLYGQQALALDTNGCLAGIGKGRASVQVI